MSLPDRPVRDTSCVTVREAVFAMAEARGVLLPAYVVADESGSMAPYQRELGDGVAVYVQMDRATLLVTLSRDAFTDGDLVAMRP